MHLNDRILAVDDHVDNLLILEELLGGEYTIRCVGSGQEALRFAPHFKPNLILLDMMMPGLDGNETCELLRSMPEIADAKIVFVSARSDVQDRLSAYDVGAVDYITKPFNEQEVLFKVRAWMQMNFKQEIEDIWQEANRTREIMGLALVSMASFRDTETGEHLFRMRWYSQVLAEQLSVAGPYRDQIDETFLRQLYRASPLHDIGKVGIDDTILRKPGRLTPAEFEVIKQHSVIGGEILSQAVQKLPHADYMRMAAEVARSHHERFDGSGYPDGLAGLDIPLSARVVAVADVFDALTSQRVYKAPVSTQEAARTVIEESGRHFDPAVVDAFRTRFEDFKQGQARFADGSLVKSTAGVGHMAFELGERLDIDHIEHSTASHSAVGV